MRTALELMLLGFALEILVGVGSLQASQPSGKEIHRVETVVVHSQPSFLLANDQVQLGVTEIGGHMAPVKFFADGLAPSIAENMLSKQGVPTTVELKASQPTVVNYIQGIARSPADFDRVATIEFCTGEITLISPDGKRIAVPVNHEFTKTGNVN